MIPQVYPAPQEPAAVNYTFLDIASGIGIAEYDAFMARGSTYHLASTSLSATGNAGDLQIISGGAGSVTLNFDTLAFGSPVLVKGNVTLYFAGAIVTTNAGTGTATIKLQKVDSSGTASDIVTIINAEQFFTRVSAGTTIETMTCVATITTPVLVNPDEKLRLNMAWTTTAAAATSIYLGIDPSSRNGTVITPASTYPTYLKVLVPLRIDK